MTKQSGLIKDFENRFWISILDWLNWYLGTQWTAGLMLFMVVAMGANLNEVDTALKPNIYKMIIQNKLNLTYI